MTAPTSNKNKPQPFCPGFSQGLTDGIPIALGYLSVSFGFGITAFNGGLKALTALLISLTNVTSAGQVAGVAVIIAGGSFAEMALTEFIINLRYALMSITLSQKLDRSFTLPHRLICAFCVTDEIFAVASSKNGPVGKSYMYGLISLPYISWAAGTLLGAVAGQLLPENLAAALGIAVYGMFIAIIIPPAVKSRGVLCAVLIAAALSCALKYIPVFSSLTQGFSIIICGIAASVAAALLFPVRTSEAVAENDAKDGEN